MFTLPSKFVRIEEAVSQIRDGAVVMIGGFGAPGTPFLLIEELVRQGPRHLTIIKNDANETGSGVDRLLENGQVDHIITSHIGLNSNAVHMMNEERIDVEFVPQGILAERIRTAGAGLIGFVTDVGIDTEIATGKQCVEIGEKVGILETALAADFALVHAAKSDPFGNLTFSATARNFNPIMAMAAGQTIVEAEECVGLGDIAPDHVHLPGNFVDHVIDMFELLEVPNVVGR
ncbi:CoA transferase subunit A [Rhodococcus sp. D-46]|uniref:3-oxoacid CoA-transferase subunit A n=1 Tax=Rhodococcus sp. D-46 TaxID=2716265 RepID=UPI001A9933B1